MVSLRVLAYLILFWFLHVCACLEEISNRCLRLLLGLDEVY